jgi:hypothetical protein
LSAKEISNDYQPKRNPDAAFRSIDEEEGGLVVLPGRAEVKVLNPVGIRIFEMIDGKNSVENIASGIAEEYEVTAEQALEDVRSFLADLSDNGMLGD